MTNSEDKETIIDDDLELVNQTQETVILTQNEQMFDEVPAVPEAEVQEDETKYEVLKELGKGGFAWVYLVRNLDLDRLEAMKILNADLAEDSDVVLRFVKEARISANFNHQNIVTIYEVQQRGSWRHFKAPPHLSKRHKEPFVYFTMSFVEGDTATRLIKKSSRIPQKQAIEIGMDACAALEYAHGLGVIHRDIKPENILVDRGGRGILMDFGIAKVVDQTQQTAAGTFMGTARYVSPEQARGADIDGRSDIYSLGITLYELVTGHVPFDSDQWMTVLYQHIHEPPPAPEKFYDGIDRDLRGIILKMLAKNQEERFQTAVEVGRALGTVYRKLGGRERQTESLDRIETRQDLVRGPATSSTEILAPEKAPTKPPIRTKVREEEAPTRVKPTPAKPGLMPWLAGATLVVLVVAAFFYFRPTATDTPVDTDPIVPIPVAQGKLLVSAFPKGRLLKITSQAGEEISVDNPNLPQILDLPEGSYTLIVGYQGRTQEMTGYVSANMLLSKVNAEFELEDDLFLLEDLR